MSIPTHIEVRGREGRSPGYLTTDGVLVLQRRGVSTNLEACLPGVSVTVHQAAGTPGEWVVVTRTPGDKREDTRHPSLSRAYAHAAARVADLLGEPVTAAPFVGAYMYAQSPGGPIEGIPEHVVSPLYYDPAAYAVRIVQDCALVAHFPGGHFDAATPADGAGVLHVREHVLHGLSRGFHPCDRRLGDEYCMRRLAWLAGVHWLEGSPAPVMCGVLQLDMTLDLVTTTATAGR